MDSDRSYYVYEISDPRTGGILYVGKGKGQRYLVHEKRVVRNRVAINPKLANKLRKILSAGLRPVYIFIQRAMTEAEAYALEQKLTLEIGLENLCNLKHGGSNGATFTEEVRAKMSRSGRSRERSAAAEQERRRKISAAKTGVPRSDATKQKLSAALIGKSFVDQFGAERAAEIGQRISDANRGQKRPKQSLALKGRFTGEKSSMYGRTHSDEFKADRRQYMLSENNPGKHKTDETRRRISASKAGKPGRKRTEEQKQRMSEKMKKSWEKRKNAAEQ